MKKIKITFIGDIMCEPLMVKAAEKGNGFDFNGVFINMKKMFSESDYVIGNLETPFAGEEAVYTKNLFSFNAPDEFAEAVKASGINLVTTANNHCLDRGVEGLIRTAKMLREKEIPFTGTSDSKENRSEAAYFELKGKRFAVISYTYGTNYSANRIILDETQEYLVNLLRPQQEFYYKTVNKSSIKKSFIKRVINKALSIFNEEQRYYVKKALHMKYNAPYPDNNLNTETIEPYLNKMRSDIKTAKEKADYVFFFPHIGGQFNLKPGEFSEYIVNEAVKSGSDAVIASHTHIVQKADRLSDVPCFFSLGNFSMSPNSVYLLHENLPDYGIAVHLYFDELGMSEITFSILKIVENKRDILTVYSVDELSKNLSKSQQEKLEIDVTQVYKTVVGKELEGECIRREYSLW